MNPLKIIQKYYNPKSKAYYFLVEHSKAVTKKALEIAKKVPELNPDLKFIKEASMLHDIGILFTNKSEIGCSGKYPYICHGYLGRKLLEKEGFPKHALVCERHVGTGISIKDIKEQKLPLPKRDMIPISIEEQIICFADKFFSKHKETLTKEKSVEEIQNKLKKFGDRYVKTFNNWMIKFKYEKIN
ncbi:MAG: HDIG domain-containing protein [Nanoarchaeota archaeon]